MSATSNYSNRGLMDFTQLSDGRCIAWVEGGYPMLVEAALSQERRIREIWQKIAMAQRVVTDFYLSSGLRRYGVLSCGHFLRMGDGDARTVVICPFCLRPRKQDSLHARAKE